MGRWGTSGVCDVPFATLCVMRVRRVQVVGIIRTLLMIDGLGLNVGLGLGLTAVRRGQLMKLAVLQGKLGLKYVNAHFIRWTHRHCSHASHDGRT